MEDYLIKAIDQSKKLRLLTIEATGVVQEAQRRHDTWPTASGVLGRTLVGALLLAGAELTDKEELTIRLLGDGPVGATIVTATAGLNVRGYVQRPHLELPLKSNGHLDIRRAVGKGTLEVTKDLGLKHPYTGQVPIVSGEIAEDLAYYLTKSEQIPSAVSLSVFVKPKNIIGAAGGFMLEALPGASDSLITETIKRIKSLPALSTAFLRGLTPERLAQEILGENCKLLEKDPVAFKCNCSKKRYAAMMETLPTKELESMIKQDHGAELTCHFCRSQYHYSEADLKEILTRKKANQNY